MIRIREEFQWDIVTERKQAEILIKQIHDDKNQIIKEEEDKKNQEKKILELEVKKYLGNEEI